jgi:hypothetical protein
MSLATLLVVAGCGAADDRAAGSRAEPPAAGEWTSSLRLDGDFDVSTSTESLVDNMRAERVIVGRVTDASVGFTWLDLTGRPVMGTAVLTIDQSSGDQVQVVVPRPERVTQTTLDRIEWPEAGAIALVEVLSQGEIDDTFAPSRDSSVKVMPNLTAMGPEAVLVAERSGWRSILSDAPLTFLENKGADEVVGSLEAAVAGRVSGSPAAIVEPAVGDQA